MTMDEREPLESLLRTIERDPRRAERRVSQCSELGTRYCQRHAASIQLPALQVAHPASNTTSNASHSWARSASVRPRAPVSTTSLEERSGKSAGRESGHGEDQEKDRNRFVSMHTSPGMRRVSTRSSEKTEVDRARM